MITRNPTSLMYIAMLLAAVSSQAFASSSSLFFLYSCIAIET
jgi:hypothetical protein